MKEKRTKILSHKKIQFALVKRIMLHWTILFMTSFVLLTIWQLLVSGEPFNLFSAHMQSMWNKMIPVFVVFLVLLPVFVYDTIKFSNTITGPIVRLQRTFQSLADGETVESISFRKNDFWQELAQDFNHLLEKTNHDSLQQSDNEPEEVSTGSV